MEQPLHRSLPTGPSIGELIEQEIQATQAEAESLAAARRTVKNSRGLVREVIVRSSMNPETVNELAEHWRKRGVTNAGLARQEIARVRGNMDQSLAALPIERGLCAYYRGQERFLGKKP